MSNVTKLGLNYPVRGICLKLSNPIIMSFLITGEILIVNITALLIIFTSVPCEIYFISYNISSICN
jgi:hypothetical protein